jgi:hypothetical protein
MLPNPRGADEGNADPRIRVGSARETIRENQETQPVDWRRFTQRNSWFWRRIRAFWHLGVFD